MKCNLALVASVGAAMISIAAPLQAQDQAPRDLGERGRAEDRPRERRGPGIPGRPGQERGNFGSPPMGRGPGGPGGFGPPGMGMRGGPGMRPRPGQVLPPFMAHRLNLSEKQQKAIEDLQEDTEKKLSKILTPEQREQLKSIREQGPPQGPRDFGPGGPQGPRGFGPGDGRGREGFGLGGPRGPREMGPRDPQRPEGFAPRPPRGFGGEGPSRPPRREDFGPGAPRRPSPENAPRPEGR